MRHGKPELDLETKRGFKISPLELSSMIAEYQQTPLAPDQSPPPSSVNAFQHCSIVMSSDLPRAVGSTHLLDKDCNALLDPVFRESSLPHTRWKFRCFSAYTWCVIFRIAWLFGFSENGEPIGVAKKRADAGALKIIELAHENGSVVLLGHGIMLYLIAKTLKRAGWSVTVKNGSRYWSYTVFEFTSPKLQM